MYFLPTTFSSSKDPQTVWASNWEVGAIFITFVERKGNEEGVDLTLCTLCNVHQKKPSIKPETSVSSLRELCPSTSSKWAGLQRPFCYALPKLGSRRLYSLHLFGTPMVATTRSAVHRLQELSLHGHFPRAIGSSSTSCSSGSSCGERTTMGGGRPIAGFPPMCHVSPG